MATDKGIWIITNDTPTVDIDGGKSGHDTGADYEDDWEIPPVRKRSRISVEDLKANMGEFLDVVQEAFEKAEKPDFKMQLEEIELSVEINGEGQVSLLGTGGKIGSKGAITLTFKRKS